MTKEQALEQRPSDDCVSREQVINAIANTNFWLSAENWSELMDAIQALPPVTPIFPKCATNGEMIKAIFPNADPKEMLGFRAQSYMWDWWGRPYEEKRGNENGSN